MNDQQIRERCTVAVKTITANNGWVTTNLTDHEKVKELESLYREAMAEGLERVAKEMVDSGKFKLNGWIEWCRQEAVLVKGGER